MEWQSTKHPDEGIFPSDLIQPSTHMPDIAHSIGELAWSGNKGGLEDSERVHTPARTILTTLLTTNANGSQI